MGVILSIVGGIICIFIGLGFLGAMVYTSIIHLGNEWFYLVMMILMILFFVLAGLCFRDADREYSRIRKR
jgi:hypothetical protein